MDHLETRIQYCSRCEEMVVLQRQEPALDLLQQSVIESRGVLIDERCTYNGPVKTVHYWKNCAGGDVLVTRDLLGGLLKRPQHNHQISDNSQFL